MLTACSKQLCDRGNDNYGFKNELRQAERLLFFKCVKSYICNTNKCLLCSPLLRMISITFTASFITLK